MKSPASRASSSVLLNATALRLAERVQQANALHKAGALSEAEEAYLGVLAVDPVNADALHFLGVLRARQERFEEAIALVRRALEQAPAYVDAWNSLGNLHKIRDELPEARRCYEQVLARAPRHAEAWHNMALVLQSMGELDKAAQCFRALLMVDPSSHGTRRNLGALFYMQNRRDDAAVVYREWLEMEPKSAIARHLLAACGGEAMPLRASDEYVRETFDRFAASFDTVLVERLDYVAPQRLVDALLPHLGPPARSLEILDAGCGTGLCGPLLREHARELVGVDLSNSMIQRASDRGYDRLEVAELSGFLAGHRNTWDLVVSADTLVYFGDLRAVLVCAAQSLRPGGLVGFTLEAMPEDENLVRLTPSGRYQHSRRHIEHALAIAGLVAISWKQEALRKEMEAFVMGWVVVARRRDAAIA
ncbi:tetratricopeptide repeat protein [Nevskia sp.]|uniref:tetratricopeptide repeat protein n=1 Tax=Nevskia sp. TaxID=1929292 RepID=UPI0025F04626|nr:tetratricopeptide repeat protein [Nevskia sp.]